VKLDLVLIFLIISFSAFSQKMMSFEEKPFPNFNLIDSQIINFSSQQQGYKNLNKEEKEFYYWVNYSRKNPKRFYDSVISSIIKLYPQLKGSNLISLKEDLLNSTSLSILKLNIELCQMAKRHSEDITSHNAAPSHNSTNGDSFIERFKKIKTRKCGGENISYGANNPIFLLVLLYLDINVPSLGHRKALLNPSFGETGIGNSFYKNGLVFMVEDFACSPN
jgi:hypothetical protein